MFIFSFAAALFATLVVACRGEGACESPDADVLILGAGMSGIAAAKTLFDNGVTNFIILEARDEIGGRMRAVDFAGVKVEAGASWIQGVDTTGSAEYETNPIWTLAQQCGLQGEFSDYDSLQVYSNNGGGVVSSADLRWDDIESAYEGAAKDSIAMQEAGEPDTSVRAALINNGWTPATEADNFVDWFNLDFCFAEPPDNTSLYRTQPTPTYDIFGEEDFFVTDQRGYAYLAECLGAEFLNDDRLRLNTTVNLIEYTDDCVCATDFNEVKYCANYGIYTFSIGVLQDEQINLKFEPDLPQYKIDAINTFSSALYLKIFVEFNETFWDDVEYIGRTSSDREDYPLFQPMGKFFDSKPNVIFATLTGETAYRVAAQDIEITKQEVRDALVSMYGEFQAEIVNILVPDWASNSLYLGAYSNTPVGVTDQTHGDIAAPVGSLYFAGEVVSNLYNGFVHGAYLSGVDVAKELLEAMPSSGEIVASVFVTVTLLAILVTLNN